MFGFLIHFYPINFSIPIKKSALIRLSRRKKANVCGGIKIRERETEREETNKEILREKLVKCLA